MVGERPFRRTHRTVPNAKRPTPPPAVPRPVLPGRDELYRMLVENVVDYAIFLVHPDGRVADWTEGAERLFGYRAEEILGRDISLLYPPEDAEAGAPARDLGTASRDGRCDALAWRVRRDGSRLWATVVITAIHDDQGRTVGFGQIVRDLTDRKEAAARYEESRQRYRSLFENNPDAVCSFDLGGRLVSANPATMALTGVAADELAGSPFWSLVTAGDRERTRTLFAAAAAGTPQHAELALAHRSGRGVPTQATLVPIVVHDAVIGVYCIAEDATERRRAEAERESLLLRERVARAEAEAANRAKDDFLAVMSHELRTPLNVITGYADLLGEDDARALSDIQRRHLGRIQASSAQLLRMIEDIIGYARMEAGGPGVTAAPVELGGLVRGVAGEAERDAHGRGLALVLDANAAPCRVETDPAKVERIVRHLLSNAVKFTERGEVRARVRREPTAAVVEVSDTGSGIDPEHLDRIFEPFWQADSTSVRRVGGTGLGLSIARRLAEMLGAELRVESRPGEGSTFTLRLPAARASAAEILDAASPADAL